jgi:hypothetical protein
VKGVLEMWALEVTNSFVSKGVASVKWEKRT